MSLAGCQINTTDVNIHLQKSLKIFDKLPKRTRRYKYSPSCQLQLMLAFLRHFLTVNFRRFHADCNYAVDFVFGNESNFFSWNTFCISQVFFMRKRTWRAVFARNLGPTLYLWIEHCLNSLLTTLKTTISSRFCYLFKTVLIR